MRHTTAHCFACGPGSLPQSASLTAPSSEGAFAHCTNDENLPMIETIGRFNRFTNTRLRPERLIEERAARTIPFGRPENMTSKRLEGEALTGKAGFIRRICVGRTEALFLRAESRRAEFRRASALRKMRFYRSQKCFRRPQTGVFGHQRAGSIMPPAQQKPPRSGQKGSAAPRGL